MGSDSILRLTVEGISHSCKRARVAFFVALVGATVVGVTLYNAQLAWNFMWLADRNGMKDWKWSEPFKQPVPAGDPEHELKDEFNSRIVESDLEQARLTVQNTEANIGLLGIRIDSADLTVFGSLAMLVLSAYLCLCARRVNHDVGFALKETDELTDPERSDTL
jgi:hypothetical protein